MGLPPRSDTSGNIDAWENSDIRIQASTNVPVKTAILQFSDDAAFSVKAEELPMTIHEQELTLNFKLTPREDGSFPAFYRIAVRDAQDNADPDPTVYSILGRRDQAPVIRLLDPGQDLDVPANAVVPLLIEAEDPDFLLRTVSLHYEINGVPVEPAEVLFDAFQSGLQKRWLGTWDFRLESTAVKPGDVVKYYLSARDNKPPLGNQSRTGELQLRIQGLVSREAVDEQLAQDRQIQQQQLRERNATSEKTAAAQNSDGAQPVHEDSPAQKPAGENATDPGAEQGPEGQPQPSGGSPGNHLSRHKHRRNPARLHQPVQGKPLPRPGARPKTPRHYSSCWSVTKILRPTMVVHRTA
jgi:hypothetical protein